MNKAIRSLVVLLPLVFSSVALFASSGDAASVLHTCGPPLEDSVDPFPANNATPQRTIRYRELNLHFEAVDDGWNFLYATRPGNDRAHGNRSQAGKVMPCFQQAMDHVSDYTFTRPLIQLPPTPPPPSFSDWIMQPVFGVRRIFAAPILLLYFLPMVLAVVRKPPHMNTILLLNIFLGWTILGWIGALYLALQEKQRPATAADVITHTAGNLSQSPSPPKPHLTQQHRIPTVSSRPARASSAQHIKAAPAPQPPAAPAIPPRPDPLPTPAPAPPADSKEVHIRPRRFDSTAAPPMRRDPEDSLD